MNQLQMINRMLWGGKDPNLLLQLLGNTSGNSNSTWVDTSIYATNAGQSTELWRPILTEDVFGTGNKGYVFDGSNDYMVCDDSDRFTFANSTNDLPFSVKFKIKFTTLQSAWIVNKRDSGGAEWQIAYTGGALYFTCFSQNNTGIYIGSSKTYTFTTGSIYEIEVSYDGSGVNTGFAIKINGTQQTGLTRYGAGTYVRMINTTANIIIGTGVGGNLNGALTDIEIWKGVV